MKRKVSKPTEDNEVQLYDRLSQAAHFREQYRFVFSATIIATFFIVPTEDILNVFLKLVLGFATFFAALYLIFTAASIKYQNPRWMYNVFYVSQRLRMRSYDIAVDCFAVGVLYFLSLFILGTIQSILNIHPGEVESWISIAFIMLVLCLPIALLSYRTEKRDTQKENDSNKLI